MSSRMTYKAAGVDIVLKEHLIPLFREIARPASGARVLGGIGGFGALVDLHTARQMHSPVLVAGTDSVGTKLKIAIAAGRHDTVGIDCVAMCVNDIICHGARPLFFLDYIGTGKLNRKVALDLVRGIARGCELAGMSLVGGETAQLPGLYRRGEYDLVGFAIGIVERARIPSLRKVRAGDALIALASNGLHSNGYSLARKALLQKGKLKLGARVPELACSLADEMLRPTTIYAKLAIELFERFTIKGLANITGGGVIENVPRVMPRGTVAVLHRGTWPVPPIFELIRRVGGVSRAEMDRTFNNGIGMVAIVPSAEADRIIAYTSRRGQAAYRIGEVARGDRGVVFG